MKFNILKNNKNTANLNSDINERTREKFILKGWIESNRKPTCTNKRTRGFLFGAQTRFKMDFSAGRSMVEMLGVLAIIGVLSIGGIQGYTIAMRKYRINEILDVLEKYAISGYATAHQKMLNDEVTIDEDGFWINDNGHKFSRVEDLDKFVSGIHHAHFVFVKSINSGDVVLLGVRMSDKHICEMLVTATGTGTLDEGSQCEFQEGYGYFANIHFMMN